MRCIAASVLTLLIVSFDLLEALIKRLSSDRIGTFKRSWTKLNKIGRYILLSIYHISMILCDELSMFLLAPFFPMFLDENFSKSMGLLPKTGLQMTAPVRQWKFNCYYKVEYVDDQRQPYPQTTPLFSSVNAQTYLST